METVPSMSNDWYNVIRSFNVFVVGEDAHHMHQNLPVNYLDDREGVGFLTVLPSRDGEGGIVVESEKSATVFVEAGAGCGDSRDLVSVKNSMNEYRDSIQDMVQGSLINVICSTLGDSFPSGVTPVMSQISAQTGAVSVGMVVLPHPDEGSKYLHHSKWSLEYTRPNLDALIMLPMENIFNIFASNTRTQDMGHRITQLMTRIMRGVMDVMTKPEFSSSPRQEDIAGFFRGAGEILVSCQEIERVPNGPYDAIQRCFKYPFHTLRRFEGAQKVLVSVCCGEAGLPMEEYLRIGQHCRKELGNETDVMIAPFTSDQRGEKPYVVIYGRDLIEKRRDGFDYPVADLPPEKAPPKLPAYYRKFYGSSRSVLSHDVSNY